MSSEKIVELNQRHLPHCLTNAADPLLKYGKQSVVELMNVSLSIFDTKHAIEINDQTY
jgi:hypothetical protein